MKRILVIFLLGVGLISVNAQEKEGVKSEGAHQSEYNADAQDREHTAEIDSRVQSSEDGEDDGDAGEQSQDASSYANTGGTDTRTTSSSGSPGILMTDDEETDGTNNIQRATLNIAGSPIPGGQSSDSKKGDGPSDNKKFDGKEQKDVPGTTKFERKQSKKRSGRK